MYSPSPTFLQPQGPPIGIYSTSATIPLSQAPEFGTHMFITTPSLMYGDLPIQCICPHCHQTIVTRVEKTTGLVSWLICGGILFLGGWLGCCLIPFCIDGLKVSESRFNRNTTFFFLKDTEHYCPSCAVLLATRRRL
jgi:lipopolysaccharide-induced tumor necrosis factor-alpha factor